MFKMDFSQIEMQCAAHFVASEGPVIDESTTARDIHTEFASKKFGVPAENVTPAMRVAATKLRWKHPNLKQAQDRIKRRDVYTHVASRMFAVPEENITPAMRQVAKKKVWWELYS